MADDKVKKADDNVRKAEFVITRQNQDLEELDNLQKKIETLPLGVNQCIEAMLAVGDAEQNFEDPDRRKAAQQNSENTMEGYVKDVKDIDDKLRGILDRLPHTTSGAQMDHSNWENRAKLRLVEDYEDTLHRQLAEMGEKRFGPINVDVSENDGPSGNDDASH